MDGTGRNTEEIEDLYRRHGAALLLFAASISGDRGHAQDALHRVFLKLIENGTLNQATDKKAYLFACIRNALLNDRKRENRNAPLEIETKWFVPPERDYAGEQNLRRALGSLPEDQREVVVLHIWGELTFAQIAELVGISANTAASRYRYALEKLRIAMFAKEKACAHSK